MLGVVSAVFFLFTILPGDPAQMMLDKREDSEQLEAIKKKYGFDQPILVQYAYYLNDLSPISWHSKDSEHYTFQSLQNSSHSVFWDSQNFSLVLKWPYLRQSFKSRVKAGK